MYAYSTCVCGTEEADDAGVDVDERQAAGGEGVGTHGLPRLPPSLPQRPSPRRRARVHIEHSGDGGQQGAGEHQVKGLRRQQDLVQVLRRAINERHRSRRRPRQVALAAPQAAHHQPPPRRTTLLPRRQLVTHVARDRLRVGDGQEAVLLVGHLQGLGCRLADTEEGTGGKMAMRKMSNLPYVV